MGVPSAASGRDGAFCLAWRNAHGWGARATRLVTDWRASESVSRALDALYCEAVPGGKP